MILMKKNSHHNLNSDVRCDVLNLVDLIDQPGFLNSTNFSNEQWRSQTSICGKRVMIFVVYTNL